MKLIDMTVGELLAAFQSSNPTPGGGSASALAAAVGASLLAMVAGLPKPRAASVEDAEQLASARARCAALAGDLAALVDADSDAYTAVMSAYRRPKATDEEKVARTAAVQEALHLAIDVPLQVMRASSAAAGHAAIVARLGNANAASDVRVALELLGAGSRGARENVAINLDSVKDAAYAGRVRGEADELERGAALDAASARRALDG
jgi:formiminotetrahydrofolate cyclodeaminase